MDILELLAKNEESIGDLYRAYADRFPEYEDLWLGLANEEEQHAGWIRRLSDQVSAGTLHVDEKRFKNTAIETYLKYLMTEVQKAKSGDMALINALSIALYIEKSLIDRKYFEVFKTDAAELQQVLLNLEAATKDHIGRLQKVWSEKRPRGA